MNSTSSPLSGLKEFSLNEIFVDLPNRHSREEVQNIYSSWKCNDTSTAFTAESYEPMSSTDVVLQGSDSVNITYPRRLQTTV